MDPNATFYIVMSEIDYANRERSQERREQHWGDAFAFMGHLCQWLLKGGFAPTVPQGTYISIGDGSEFAYTVLSVPERLGGGATFVRWRLSESGQYEPDSKFACP